MNIVNDLYEELKIEFEHLEHNQVLVVMALALEKMWEPYLVGIQKSGCTELVESEMFHMAEQCMQRIWERIKRGKPCLEDLGNWNKMCDRFNDIFDGEEIEFSEEALWFDGELVGSAWLFLDDSEFDIKRCASMVSRVLEMIIGKIDSVLYKDHPKLKMQDPEQYQSIIMNHPAIINELKQINLDIQLAERYPRNLDEILDKAAEYHKLNLCDIKPIESYGIHI